MSKAHIAILGHPCSNPAFHFTTMRLVLVLFSIMACILASYQAIEENLLKNREISMADSDLSTAKSSLIPIPKPVEPQSDFDKMSTSFRSYNVFSPKDLDENKYPITRTDFFEEFLSGSKSSNDIKEASETTKKDEDSENSAVKENAGEHDEEGMFEMD